jgi:hypothetical protein
MCLLYLVCFSLCGVIHHMPFPTFLRWGLQEGFWPYGIPRRWKCGCLRVVIMFFGVTVGLLHLERSFLWQMFTHLARMGKSKGCGIRSLRGYNRWGGAVCASAVNSMLLNMWMNGALLGRDLDLWITFLVTSTLKSTTWWIFLCTATSLLGSKAMVSRWVALICFCFQKSGAPTGQTVSRCPTWGAYLIIVLWFWPRVRRIGDLGPLGCSNAGETFLVIMCVWEISGNLSRLPVGVAMYWRKNSSWLRWH